jgi:hypothetical protein
MQFYANYVSTSVFGDGDYYQARFQAEEDTDDADQTGQASGASTTGIRLCSSAHNSFGVVVITAKLRTHSPAGERQFSHNPASAIKLRSTRATAYGCLPVAVFFHS